MHWHSWSPASFRAAADSGRPLLLFLTAGWSGGCARMERDTLGDPRVLAVLDREYIPLRVDTDLRPDVAERYALGGWPSTLLLTDEGEVLQGGTYFDAPSLADLLARVSAIYRADRAGIARRAAVARAGRAGAAMRDASKEAGAGSQDEILAWLLAQAESAGGFAGAPKFLHADAVLFLLRSGSAAAVRVARDTLDAAVHALVGEHGEVFRCAAAGDWADVVRELTPETQASALRLFIEGSLRMEGRYLEPLRETAAFARATWFGGGAASLQTDSGANLAGACLGAARLLGDADLGRAALALLERVSLSTYRPGHGVRHYESPDAPSLLSDHVSTMDALLDARDATGDVPYAMLAEELGHRVLGAFMDEHAGALRDRVHSHEDVGRESEPLYPFALNARAAGVLGRLAAASGEPGFAEAAARLSAWAAGRWRGHGLDAAACGSALLI